MPPPSLHAVVETLPHAVAQLDGTHRLVWIGPQFGQRVGLDVCEGQHLRELLEPGEPRSQLEDAIAARRVFFGAVLTRKLAQVWARARPLEDGSTLLVFERSGPDDPMGFAGAFQEIARAVGETLDVDTACAAAVVAMVRTSHVSRAEVFLQTEAGPLRRVASSNLSGMTPPPEAVVPSEDTVRAALITGQPQLGVATGSPEVAGCIFAAVPVTAQRKATGVLALYKPRGEGFSMRELELWSAVGGQLGVAVENGRLFREAAAALRVREEFMSIASHELKTPLTSLKMGVHAMERRLSHGQAVDLLSVAKWKRQLDRLSALVTELLDASHLERGRVTVTRGPLELGHLVAEVVNGFRHAHERTIDLDVPAQRIWVAADRDRLEQVVLNLLENAHKYSPASDAISVSVHAVGGQGELRVCDRGIGVPLQEQQRIFERFYRAKNSSPRHFGGLGLGLFISRSILQLHGGELALHSEEGHGATFTATLPLLSDEARAQLPSRAVVLDVDRRSETALQLTRAGFDVSVVADASEALSRLTQLPADVLVVVSPVETLPGQALRAAVQDQPATRRLAMIISGTQLPAWAPDHAVLCPPQSPEPLVHAARALTQAGRIAAGRG